MLKKETYTEYDDDPDTNQYPIIRDMYIITQLLGKGKFGVVYKAEDMTNGEYVAIKTEKSNTEYSSIKHEVRIMSYLFRYGFKKLPKIHWYGIQNNLTCLEMCYFDRSLILCFQEIRKNNSQINTIVSKIMIQCIDILESLHDLFVIHRDIKPHNFVIRNHQLYLIDYGLATFFVDEDGEHLPNVVQETITGTPKFLSYNNHVGNTLSRRDDLISLGSMCFFLIFDKLPWQMDQDSLVVQPQNKKKMSTEKVISMKSWNNMSKEIEKSGISVRLFEYMKYCYGMNYEDEPDYEYLCTLFT